MWAPGVYEKLRAASAAGVQKRVYYPSGLLLAQNYAEIGDTDSCGTILFFTGKWAAAGSGLGISPKVFYSGKDWIDTLFSRLKMHSCTDKTIPALSTESFDFTKVEGFVRKMEEGGYTTLWLLDWKDERTLRSITLDRPGKGKPELSKIRLPSEKQINEFDIFKSGRRIIPNGLTEAKIGRRTEADILRILDAHRAEVQSLYRSRREGNPELEGRIQLKIVILPTGIPKSIEVLEDGMNDKGLNDGMVRIFQSVDFGKIHSLADDVVVVPFNFAE